MSDYHLDCRRCLQTLAGLGLTAFSGAGSRAAGEVGYAAISTFHFGNPDFTNSEPWLNRYHDRLRLVQLTLDGERVEPTAVQARNPQGAIVDRYHLLTLPDPKPGAYTVVAQVERLEDGARQELRLEFTV